MVPAVWEDRGEDRAAEDWMDGITAPPTPLQALAVSAALLGRGRALQAVPLPVWSAAPARAAGPPRQPARGCAPVPVIDAATVAQEAEGAAAAQLTERGFGRRGLFHSATR